LIEDIRNELFNQIPDEKSYTDYALTGRSSNPSILVGKLYKIVEQTSKYGFKLEVEDGEVIYCLFKNCAFLNGRDWTIINVED
jgi:CBS domain containing-hemolysin-like protein